MTLTNVSENLLSPEAISTIPLVLRHLRKSRNLSREQLARRLGLTSPVVYNMELGRTRIRLDHFIKVCSIVRVDLAKIFATNTFSVQPVDHLRKVLTTANCGSIFTEFRRRLRCSQGDIARQLGYRSASMVHHFEKGIRTPSVEDLFKLLVVAGDNLRGMISDLTGNAQLANAFPAGIAVTHAEWHEYWADHFIPAMRQLMRTETFLNLKRLRMGWFADTLGITLDEERRGLAVLGRLGIIRWEKAKPQLIPGVKIVIPQNIPQSQLDRFKDFWINFARHEYLKHAPAKGNGSDNLMSIDLMPTNQKSFAKVIALIRELQNEIHNDYFEETDGFMTLGWLATYKRAPTR